MGRKKGSLNANRENMNDCSLYIRVSQEQLRYLRSKKRYSEFIRKLIQERMRWENYGEKI